LQIFKKYFITRVRQPFLVWRNKCKKWSKNFAWHAARFFHHPSKWQRINTQPFLNFPVSSLFSTIQTFTRDMFIARCFSLSGYINDGHQTIPHRCLYASWSTLSTSSLYLRNKFLARPESLYLSMFQAFWPGDSWPWPPISTTRFVALLSSLFSVEPVQKMKIFSTGIKRFIGVFQDGQVS